MDGALSRLRADCTGFAGFGPSAYCTKQPQLESYLIDKDFSVVREHIRTNCAELPGVYGMVDGLGQLIYVGTSGNLRKRLATYFYNTSEDTKQSRIACNTQSILWEVLGHEFTALLRELELIRRWQPRFNVRSQPKQKRSGFLFLSDNIAPHFRIDRLLPSRSRLSWGPLPLSFRTKSAVEQLNYAFKLRDCPRTVRMNFADQGQLFEHERLASCDRAQMGTCLAPCAGWCTQQDYSHQINAARAFLDGRDASILNQINRSIEEETNNFNSEKASILRDQWDELVYLGQQLQLTRDASGKLQVIYEIERHSSPPQWVVIAGGGVAAVKEAPNSPQDAMRCRKLIESNFDKSRREVCDDFELVRMVVSWFRRNPNEWANTMSPDEALLKCLAWISARNGRSYQAA